MKTAPLGAWRHGLPATFGLMVKHLEPDEADKQDKKNVLAVDGYILIPMVHAEDGDLVARMYVEGLDKEIACAIKTAILTMTGFTSKAECGDCDCLNYAVGLIARVFSKSSRNSQAVQRAAYTLLKAHLCDEQGLPTNLIAEDDYDESSTLEDNCNRMSMKLGASDAAKNIMKFN